ncbi:MAG TPA: hypothetical protein VGG70_07035 [Candidatus Cybelea sp.]
MTEALAARSAAAAAGCFTRGAAIAASAGLVRESFARKELLFTRGERKRACAIDAGKGFVGVHFEFLTCLSVVRYLSTTRKIALEGGEGVSHKSLPESTLCSDKSKKDRIPTRRRWHQDSIGSFA